MPLEFQTKFRKITFFGSKVASDMQMTMMERECDSTNCLIHVPEKKGEKEHTRSLHFI